jgi:DNA-binding transcriptional LysR family regulator
MDRLDAMQVLLAVVDAGSLSAGSRALNAPLPSVSRKVADLERHLGTRLLIRTSRKIQLTDAGRDYVDAARQIVAQIKDAEVRASGEYQVPRGALTITMPTTLGREVVLPFAYAFLCDHPEISLHVLALDRTVQLIDERVDVGIRMGDLTDSSLYAVKVGEVTLITCASPAYLEREGQPTSPEELHSHSAVIFSLRNETVWPYRYKGGHVEGRPNPRVYANTTDATVQAAVQGLGIVRAPNYQVVNELRSGALIPLFEQYESKVFPVHLVYFRQGLLPLKVRTFIDWMTPRLRQAFRDIGDIQRPASACESQRAV